MFRNGIFLAACVLGMSVIGQSDEPTSTDHRVAPELLKELSTDAPKATSAPSPAAITLEDLKQLAEKLKASGDEGSAEFLERYVQEQESATVKVSYVVPPRLMPTSPPISIEIEAFEVNGEDVPNEFSVNVSPAPNLFLKSSSTPLDSPLKSYFTPQKIKQFREELGRMVAANKATVVIRSQTVPARFNQVTKFTEERGEIEIPGPDADSPPSAKRFVGIQAQSTAKLQSTGMLELQQIIESSHINEKNAITVNEKTIPGMTTTRIESVQETIAGQPILLALPSQAANRRCLYVFTTVNPKATDDNLAPPEVEK